MSRHGHWIEDRYGYYSCSECGWEWDEAEYKTPYCPKCGACMLSETEEKTPNKCINWYDEPGEG